MRTQCVGDGPAPEHAPANPATHSGQARAPLTHAPVVCTPQDPASARRWFEIPDPDGSASPAVLSGLAFGEPARPLDLLFLHANGFNALTYRGMLEPLATRLRLLAMDLEGHGQSPRRRPTGGRANWNGYRDDLTALIDQLGGPPLVLAGHSMGATIALMAAAERMNQVRGLVLIDPVAPPRDLVRRLAGATTPGPDIPLTIAARKRRRLFASRAEALDNYRGRGVFKTWPEAALSDYVEGGFRTLADGSVELICTPEWEAGNFAAMGQDPWAALDRVIYPVVILRAETGSTCDLAGAKKAARGRANRRVETIAGSTHFLPIEQPTLIRKILERAVLGDVLND